MRSSVSDTLLVTVFSENDPPIINPLDPISFDEDQSYELPSMESLIGNGTIIDIDTDIEDLGFDIFVRTNKSILIGTVIHLQLHK